MAYTIETIIAEKFESIISKNITTTRSKDFYDLYMLMKKHSDKINKENLVRAIYNTFSKRKTKYDVNYFEEIYKLIKDSDILRANFRNYKRKLEYVQNVDFDDTINAIKDIKDIIDILFSNTIK